MNTYDTAALECLAAIVEEGGFERAAQRLNVTQSAVSQRLRALDTAGVCMSGQAGAALNACARVDASIRGTNASLGLLTALSGGAIARCVWIQHHHSSDLAGVRSPGNDIACATALACPLSRGMAH